jgi:hypothetical protein
VNEVPDHVERTPRLAAFMRVNPPVRKAAEQCVESRGRALEDGSRFVHREEASRPIAGHGSV